MHANLVTVIGKCENECIQWKLIKGPFVLGNEKIQLEKCDFVSHLYARMLLITEGNGVIIE